ncbi:FAD-dependent oxidoreductase [Paludisphaera soli]|uniref:FAD-dependent oxidoreductase n=1 Tax=Paludisphaera soli TaxID=2712865 RepID=UPI0013EB8457|nr:FAD-dependent oxidoreductase [Paludisphaera soli]
MLEQDLDAIAFPVLDEVRMAAFDRCPLTRLRRYRDGERLFEAGDRECKLDVVRSGEVEIRDESGETPKVIVVLRPGQFTGDVAQLAGSPALVAGVARGETEVYEVSPEALRDLLNLHLDVADIILQAFIARWRYLREPGRFTGLRVIGRRDSPETFRVRTFLAKNGVPFTWLDLDAGPQAGQLLREFGASEAETPVVAWGRKRVVSKPSDRDLAEALGLRHPLEPREYDLAVVGAGPAGLAAAVYGASEGLSTVVLETTAPGGQAGRSMRIENYLGFPIGITGAELAERAFVQAIKFGAILSVAAPALRLNFDDGHAVIHLDGGESVSARCLLIATGAEYRRLGVEGCERFEGRGVYYAATPIEAQMCWGSDVVVIGGGNSAGQAAVFLATQVRKVYLVIRGDDLSKDMSAYLARRIEENPMIDVLRNTEVRRVSGDDHLGEVELVSNKTGEVRTLRTPALFSFIGAVPRTDWLPAEIERDERGFVRTGPALAHSPGWTAKRPPFLLEASRPGVFAAGDVRSGSVKRVASAVGEGAMAVQFVHEFMKEI